MLDDFAQHTVSRGLKEGSRDAWATLYDGYSVELWRYVARLLGLNAAGVADVVQETFLEAARTARQFDAQRGTLWNWLCGIARYRVLAHWREANRARRLQEITQERAAEFGSALVDGTAFDRQAQQQELAEVVRFTLAQLTPDYSTLLTAKYCDEQSLDELSRVVGATPDAVKSKLARARREFRSVFEQITQRTATPARS